jgi:hypothetical protein
MLVRIVSDVNFYQRTVCSWWYGCFVDFADQYMSLHFKNWCQVDMDHIEVKIHQKKKNELWGIKMTVRLKEKNTLKYKILNQSPPSNTKS